MSHKQFIRRERGTQLLPAKITVLVLTVLLLAMSFIAGSILTLSPAVATPQSDIGYGPGVGWNGRSGSPGAGAFIMDGQLVYCVEIGIITRKTPPIFKPQNTIPAYSKAYISAGEVAGDELKQMSFIISKYGQTNDNVQTAAVALAVWKIRDRNGGNSGHNHELKKVLRVVGEQVNSRADSMLAEASSWVRAASQRNAAISIETPYRGTIAIPQGITELNIHNGRFSDDDSTTKKWQNGAPAGTVLSWVGIPPHDRIWDRYYRVWFNGKQIVHDEQILFGNGGGRQSTIKLRIPKDREKHFEASYSDADTLWAPEVTSAVASKFIKIGDNFSDTVTFSPAKATAALSDTWRWRINDSGEKEWMPVTATGTLYGPFLSDPALNPSREAPRGAPVVARTKITTDPRRDHSTAQTYQVSVPQTVQEQGFYTWKWDIDTADQDPAIIGTKDCTASGGAPGCRAFPEKYFYTDGFGAREETQVGKMPVKFKTELSAAELTVGTEFTDTVKISAKDNWLRDSNGDRIPLTLTGTAYLYSGVELPQSATVPDSAVAIGTVKVTTDPAKNEQDLVSPAIRLPLNTDPKYSFVTMRWCVVDADQSTPGIWDETCDDFGVPTESAKIVRPIVVSKALKNASVFDSITDTAIVTGSVPENTSIVFELYKKPDLNDIEQSNHVIKQNDAATEQSDQSIKQEDQDVKQRHRGIQQVLRQSFFSGSPVCTPANKIATTAPKPVTSGVAQEAEYVSDALKTTGKGVYWWIEKLIATHPDDGTVTLHEGKCGIENETTEVTDATVVTKTRPEVHIGEKTFDTATVSGVLPSTSSGVKTELTFAAYKALDTNAPVCETSNMVFALDKPVLVESIGAYESEKVSFSEPGVYYWVETLTYVKPDGERIVAHRGKCGLPDETVKVTPSPILEVTGAVEKIASELGLLGFVVAGSLAAAGIGAIGYGIYRRNKPQQ
ncbi:hypothetical protein KJY78_00370 [Canibacter sp. lx-45]|uniref:hypothetical protein n=1 Tax=Canibacter zhuwentaonis TaxID=2837491 RepID=UPI001BDD2BD4|nr:hypothetical protein [Canibacter zhuwentaonis]MBT1034813.1 hypothetical protein [Canibacter zhuwentaonis]